jgi:ribonuclease D
MRATATSRGAGSTRTTRSSNSPPPSRALEDLGRSRLLLREARKGEIADGILEAVRRGLEMPADEMPKPDTSRDQLQVNGALADLLRVLLKAKSEEAGVAAKLIASAAELDEIAAGIRDGAGAQGLAGEGLRGRCAEALRGKVALTANGRAVEIVEL